MNQAYGETMSCRSKARYNSEQHATQVATDVYYKRRTPLRVYACSLCGGYHLTRRDAPQSQNWRPPKKSQRQLAYEKNERRDERRKRIR